MIHIAVFISGRGSNLNAIIQAIADKRLDAKIETVISNDKDAAGLLIAEQHGLNTYALSQKGMTRAQHEEKILEHLNQFKLDYLVLAGYMRLLSPDFLRHFKSEHGHYNVINIHPSLLPAFPGTDSYKQAFDYGVKVGGVTVHLIDESMDKGIIIAQEPFPRFPDDTLETFTQRGLSVEHSLYPAVLQQIAKHGIESKPKQKLNK